MSTTRHDAVIFAELRGGPLDGETCYLRMERMRGHNHWWVKGDRGWLVYEARGEVLAFLHERRESSGFFFGPPPEQWQETATQPPTTALHYAGEADRDEGFGRVVKWSVL